ncbi:hypothetical protein EDB89DRAFT_1909976 [Lactarius sanguifluus]|nr:hypothetical protein EDB89DRAFT_1909976 [Lactarius sanguifluus]
MAVKRRTNLNLGLSTNPVLLFSCDNTNRTKVKERAAITVANSRKKVTLPVTLLLQDSIGGSISGKVILVCGGNDEVVRILPVGDDNGEALKNVRRIGNHFEAAMPIQALFRGRMGLGRQTTQIHRLEKGTCFTRYEIKLQIRQTTMPKLAPYPHTAPNHSPRHTT